MSNWFITGVVIVTIAIIGATIASVPYVRNLFVSEGVKLLAKNMIENPHNWKQGAYHYICINSPDVRIWTANGALFIKLEGNDSFNIAEKRHINKAIQKSIALRTVIPNEPSKTN